MQIQERWNSLTQPLARHWPTGRWTPKVELRLVCRSEVDGILKANDSFMTSNNSGVGDARNIIDLTGLQLIATTVVASRNLY